jgi:hypothetical protein
MAMPDCRKIWAKLTTSWPRARFDRGGQPGHRDIGLAGGQHLGRIDARAALDQFDRDPLALVEALLPGDVEPGELRLVVPVQLDPHPVRRLCASGRRGREWQGQQRQ